MKAVVYREYAPDDDYAKILKILDYYQEQKLNYEIGLTLSD